MQKAIAIVLFSTLMLPFGLKLAILSNYALNLHYYQTVLCENKDKPALKCNGKCHLKKELLAIEPKADSPKAPALPSIHKLTLENFEIPDEMELKLPVIVIPSSQKDLPVPATAAGYFVLHGAPPDLFV